MKNLYSCSYCGRLSTILNTYRRFATKEGKKLFCDKECYEKWLEEKGA